MCGPGQDSDIVFDSVSNFGWTQPGPGLADARP